MEPQKETLKNSKKGGPNFFLKTWGEKFKKANFFFKICKVKKKKRGKPFNLGLFFFEKDKRSTDFLDF